MEYILSLDNHRYTTITFDGSHAEAIKKFTGSFIGSAQVVCVYKPKRNRKSNK